MPKITDPVVWGHKIRFRAYYRLHIVVECLLIGVSPSTVEHVHNWGEFKHAYGSFIHFVIVDSWFEAAVC